MSSDIAALEAPIPTSIAPAVESKVESDVISYAANLVDTPQFTSVVSALGAVVPSSVQSQIASAPADFLISLITESRYPPWVSAIPTPFANYILSVANHVVGIAADDLADALPTPTVNIWGVHHTGSLRNAYPTAGPGHRGHKAGHHAGTGYYSPSYPTDTGFVKNPYPTGTGFARNSHPSGKRFHPSGTGALPSGTGVVPVGSEASNSTVPTAPTTGPTSTPAPINSAAPPRSGDAVSMVAIVIGIGFLLLL